MHGGGGGGGGTMGAPIVVNLVATTPSYDFSGGLRAGVCAGGDRLLMRRRCFKPEERGRGGRGHHGLEQVTGIPPWPRASYRDSTMALSKLQGFHHGLEQVAGIPPWPRASYFVRICHGHGMS